MALRRGKRCAVLALAEAPFSLTLRRSAVLSEGAQTVPVPGGPRGAPQMQDGMKIAYGEGIEGGIYEYTV